MAAPDQDFADSVAVIIPTYNRNQTVIAAALSALMQTHSRTWVFIVDDGSTDDSERSVEKLSRHYPKRLQYLRKQNGGCSSARNLGLNTIGDRFHFVCFLDSDDLLLERKIENDLNLLSRDESIDFVYSDYLLFDESRKILQRFGPAASDPREFAIRHFLTNEAKPSSVLYRASILKNLRFREDLRYNEDSEFLERVALQYRGHYSQHLSAWIRSHEGSKSKNRIEILRAGLRFARDLLKDYPTFHQKYSEKVDRRVKQIERQLFIQLCLAERWSEAEIHIQSQIDKLIVNEKMNMPLRIKDFLCSRYDLFIRPHLMGRVSIEIRRELEEWIEKINSTMARVTES